MKPLKQVEWQAVQGETDEWFCQLWRPEVADGGLSLFIERYDSGAFVLECIGSVASLHPIARQFLNARDPEHAQREALNVVYQRLIELREIMRDYRPRGGWK